MLPAAFLSFLIANRWTTLVTIGGTSVSGGPEISLIQLGISFLVVLTVAFFGWYLELGIASDILVASVRSIVQLSILGLILAPSEPRPVPLLHRVSCSCC